MGTSEDCVGGAKVGDIDEMRVDVFPDDFLFGSDLEDAPEHSLGNERVAVGEATGTGDVGTEEVVEGCVGVGPDDFAGGGGYFYYAGVGQGMVLAVGAVVEDEDVAVVEHARVVLLGQGVVVDLPGPLAGILVYDADGGDVAEADHDAVAGQRDDSVAVSPLVAEVTVGDDVSFGVEVFVRAPLPDAVAGGVDLDEGVGPHIAFNRQAAFDLGGQIVGDFLHGQVDGAAGLGTAGVVVVVRVAVLPDHVAVPVDLHQHAALETIP